MVATGCCKGARLLQLRATEHNDKHTEADCSVATEVISYSGPGSGADSPNSTFSPPSGSRSLKGGLVPSRVAEQ